MFQYVLTICFCFFLTVTGIHAEERPLLQDLGKDELLEKAVLSLSLSTRPEFRLEVSGQRIDLFLRDTDVGSALDRLPQDGSILRTLLARKGQDLMVSFLLVRPPREVKVIAAGEGSDLAVHIGWNGGRKKVRPAIASRLRGMLRAEESGSMARVVARSRYSPHWESFYREYRTPIAWQMVLRYTFPELPALDWAKDSPVLREARQHSLAERWSEALTLLDRLSGDERSRSDRQAYLMLHSAVLLQTGSYDQARQLYQRFKRLFPGTRHSGWFRVLIACGRAQAGDPYGAVSEIGGLLRKGNAKGPVGNALAELLFAEVQLATGRPRQALAVLEKIVADGDGRLSRAVLLRTADARAASGLYREALPGYRAWLAKGSVDGLDAYSLALLATTLEQQGEIREAEQLYLRLAGLTQKDEGRALALFGAARALLQRGEAARVRERCAMIRKEYPQTEGAYRAWLMDLDLDMAGDKKARIMERSGEYAEIAAVAPLLVLREEAAFKDALTFVLAGRTSQGLKMLHGFRRDFAGGSLRNEAEVLTLERLEPLVTGLMREGKPLDALVLIEQNRDLLATFTLPPGFTAAVGGAFRDLGLLERSAHVYSYQLDDAAGTEAAEQFYLPLVEVFYDDGRYREVLNTVRRYRQRFPAGAHLASLQLFQGRSLLALGRLEEAVAMLPGIQLSSREVLILRNQVVMALAVRDGAGSTSLGGMLAANAPGEQSETQLLRAERLWQEGRGIPALAIFQELIAADNFVDQARYRSGQICLESGDQRRGINFLHELVEKGNDLFWQNLARQMLALAGVS